MNRLVAVAATAAVLVSGDLAWSASLGLSSSTMTTVQLPSPSLYALAVATTDDKGGGKGKLDIGDSTTLTYRGTLRPSSLCSSWTATTAPQTATGLTVALQDGTGASGADVVVLDASPTAGCTSGLRLGTVDTGSPSYATAGPVAFTNTSATLTWTATGSTVVVVFGTRVGVVDKAPGTSVVTWTVNPAALDGNGLPVATGTTSSTAAVQW